MASHDVPRAAHYAPRTEKERQEELREIEQYQSLVELIESKISERQYIQEVLQLTSQLLLKNPEYYTIWNIRRRLLVNGLFQGATASSQAEGPAIAADTGTPLQRDDHAEVILDLIRKDLDFLVPLLRKWPKCYWIWNYRVWLLQEATARLEATTARRLWADEFKLVSMMLVKDNRNFHGWRYRRIIVAELESASLGGTSMVEAEYEYTTKMIKSNLSNFSAWHNRSCLIPRLLNERGADMVARRKMLDDEFEMITNALWVDPADQSLWFYYQFLMTVVVDPKAQHVIAPELPSADRIAYVQNQLTNLKDLLDGAEDCKWIYVALIEYTMALWKLKSHVVPPEVLEDLRAWLTEIRKLDKLRSGRWDQLESLIESQT